MSEFEFAKMPKEYDCFSSPTASPAAGDHHSPFEFAKTAPRDFFGNVIETATSEPKPEVIDDFEFAPIRKERGYFDAPDEAARPEDGSFSKSASRFRVGDYVKHNGRLLTITQIDPLGNGRVYITAKNARGEVAGVFSLRDLVAA